MGDPLALATEAGTILKRSSIARFRLPSGVKVQRGALAPTSGRKCGVRRNLRLHPGRGDAGVDPLEFCTSTFHVHRSFGDHRTAFLQCLKAISLGNDLTGGLNGRNRAIDAHNVGVHLDLQFCGGQVLGAIPDQPRRRIER